MTHIYDYGWTVTLEISSAQLQGDRALQEDCVLVRSNSDALIVMLADGVGGHAKGEYASQVACFAAMRALEMSLRQPMQDLERGLRACVLAADAAVRRLSPANWVGLPPATTLIVGAFVPRLAQFHAAYVGDSLLYRLRDGKLELLFSPQRLIAPVGMLRKRVTSGAAGIEVQSPLELRPGDRFLFASDGIEPLLKTKIQEFLEQDEPRRACEGLARELMIDPARNPYRDYFKTKGLFDDNSSLVVVFIDPPPEGAM